MPAAGVIEPFDSLEHGRRELRPGVPARAVQELALHRRPEALDERVIDAGGDSAHRSEQTGLAEPVPEEPRGVWRSAVRVNDRAGLGTASPARHLERVDDDLRGDAIGNRPADDAA